MIPFLAALAALLAAGGPSGAQGDAPGPPPPAGLYGVARGGVLLPRGSFGNARGRGSGEVALGWIFGPHLAAEVAVAFYGATGTATVVTGAGPVELPVDYELLPVAASLRAGWRLGPLEPYLAAGVGLWQVRAIVSGAQGSRSTQPGAQAALGVDLALGGGFAAGLQGRWLATRSRRSADPEVRATAVFGGLGYRF